MTMMVPQIDEKLITGLQGISTWMWGLYLRSKLGVGSYLSRRSYPGRHRHPDGVRASWAENRALRNAAAVDNAAHAEYLALMEEKVREAGTVGVGYIAPPSVAYRRLSYVHLERDAALLHSKYHPENVNA
jgi:hypothetical protein